ncbi:winged helix-turn-helix domain-containing protein [Mesorhizobium sp. LSHC412B00]|uniref:winged helix-turn-helix domain-containing protein n=1 Tax=Mesorhizobium sp. LSHC412B00 TaxID=1287285 RepID=UPI0003CF9250|nr:winged helix-turn-helix domain-containing protein [Mesorhizobium sp. LSHC412B00]ESX84844.1 histidine kinase [Mesorhizobium sp. LSHC412B00]
MCNYIQRPVETTPEGFDSTSNDDTGRDSPPPPMVLIAAADDSFRSLLEYIVKKKGLVVTGVTDAGALAKCLQELTPDVPGVETKTLCAGPRLEHRTRSMSIIALAAQGDEAGRQKNLKSGANQYVSRPFSPEPLMGTRLREFLFSWLTSVRAIGHDSNRDPAVGGRDLLTFLDLEMDATSYRVRRNGRMIHLAPTEFRLLHHLMKNPRTVYSRDELRNVAWPRAVHIGPRTIDVHIGRLRAALNGVGEQDLIRTVRCVGYSLSE